VTKNTNPGRNSDAMTFFKRNGFAGVMASNKTPVQRLNPITSAVFQNYLDEVVMPECFCRASILF